MSFWTNLAGTVAGFFRVGLTGPRLKNSSGALEIRNSGDTAYADLTAATIRAAGDSLVINSDAAGSGADYAYTLARPASGMTSAVTLTLPVSDGSPGEVLATDGAGGLSWTPAGSTAASEKTDSTSLAFGSGATVGMFTLPAAGVISTIRAEVDTAFDGTPSFSVGIAGQTSKYVSSTEVDLTQAAVFEIRPGKPAPGEPEDLIISYSAGGATVGTARVLVTYAEPT